MNLSNRTLRPRTARAFGRVLLVIVAMVAAVAVFAVCGGLIGSMS